MSSISCHPLRQFKKKKAERGQSRFRLSKQPAPRILRCIPSLGTEGRVRAAQPNPWLKCRYLYLTALLSQCNTLKNYKSSKIGDNPPKTSAESIICKKSYMLIPHDNLTSAYKCMADFLQNHTEISYIKPSGQGISGRILPEYGRKA